MVVLVVVVVILELITIDIKKCEKYKEEKLNLENILEKNYKKKIGDTFHTIIFIYL